MLETIQSGSRYFMEDLREAERLTEKVRPSRWIEQYLRPHLASARSVLDVGCGPAVIVAEIARQYPGLRASGVDQSGARVATATENLRAIANARVRQGSAYDLPFSDHSFDVVYTRFLLEYLEDKEKALAEMRRVCKPGGTILLQDLDGQLVWHYPEDAGLRADLEKVLHTLAGTGFDPFVGRKLFSLVKRAGLEPIQVSAESYHLFAGRIDPFNEHLWNLKLDIALPAAAKALGSREAAEELKRRFMDYLRRDDTLTYSTLFTVAGRNKR